MTWQFFGLPSPLATTHPPVSRLLKDLLESEICLSLKLNHPFKGLGKTNGPPKTYIPPRATGLHSHGDGLCIFLEDAC